MSVMSLCTLTLSIILFVFIPIFVMTVLGLGWCLFDYYTNRESMKDEKTNYYFVW